MIDPLFIQITRHCSAACNHCPFGRSQSSDGNELSLEALRSALRENDRPYALVTGGEPLEHSRFAQVLEVFDELEFPYRLATGGHIDLSSHLPRLLDSPGFMGFSIGTDVISRGRKRNSKPDLAGVWGRNIFVLHEAEMPYSLTVTCGPDFSLADVVEQAKSLGATPAFFLLSETEGYHSTEQETKEQIQTIHRCFPDAEIKFGYRN